MCDAQRKVGLDQEGSVKSIKLWGRMLLGSNNWRRRRGLPDDRKNPRILKGSNGRGMQRDVPRWQHARSFRRHHVLAAALAMVSRRAGHGAATLHALLIKRHCRQAIGKPEKQECTDRQRRE